MTVLQGPRFKLRVTVKAQRHFNGVLLDEGCIRSGVSISWPLWKAQGRPYPTGSNRVHVKARSWLDPAPIKSPKAQLEASGDQLGLAGCIDDGGRSISSGG